MLAHRLRRRPNIKPALVQRLMLAEDYPQFSIVNPGITA